MIPLRMVGFVLLGTISSWPSEAAEAKTTASDDSLTATKRELETLRNERLLPQESVKLGVPAAIEAPMLPTLAVPLPATGAKGKATDINPGAAGKNWLIDAMQKNAKTSEGSGEPRGTGWRSDRAGEEEAVEIDPLTGKPSLVRRDRETQGNPDGARQTAPAKNRPGDNPLNRYMDDWLSPQDYVLLEGSSVASPAGRTDFSPGPGGRVPSINVGSLGGGMPPATPTFGASFGIGPGMGDTRRENPYLRSLEVAQTPDLAVGRGITPAAPPQPAQMSVVMPPPSPGAKPAPFLQENLKRSDDTKYFPQLKRF